MRRGMMLQMSRRPSQKHMRSSLRTHKDHLEKKYSSDFGRVKLLAQEREQLEHQRLLLFANNSVHSERQGRKSYASLVGGQECEQSQRKIIGQRIYRSKILSSSAPKVPHSAYACAQLKFSDSYSKRNPQGEPKSRQSLFYCSAETYTLF